ncbi:hypothetical protein CXG81DRAFT_26046 [Caulochytrium protostelioides]|uniref:Superoxide dismutase 1 copper chaperone n=1 Tax=Caulochytrium protostelioides TaxID=1555241 RepID=A0A4P9X7S0_9FUNG|nr:hypothetical protein CXG81DRAFT_26046 [Caulochytrium protostelioides]|eukprot:RKP01285.1 hypothetical protein CXG81DRAFT_26046 [Caulochytrium protostelioides]
MLAQHSPAPSWSGAPVAVPAPLTATAPLAAVIRTHFALRFQSRSQSNAVLATLQQLPHIRAVRYDAARETLAVEGHTAPSVLLRVLSHIVTQTTIHPSAASSSTALPLPPGVPGPDAAGTAAGSAAVIFRGAQVLGPDGASFGAATCIFEAFPGAEGWAQHNNRGLARLVGLDAAGTTLVDLSVHGLPPHTPWGIALHAYGNLADGVASIGPAQRLIGALEVDARGEAAFVAEVAGLPVSELIGRSLVVAPLAACELGRPAAPDALAAVVARSAGAFENEKKVCSCSGRTLWQESRPMM